ncbi:SDR family NAD(P)-dependent oxidoreductase [Microbacterium neimengense]
MIMEAAPDAVVDVILVDLARTDDVARAGTEIAGRHDHVDILINNAGIHAFEQRVTDEGYPEMIAVNYLAPWVLTRTLLPRLRATPGARIVNVGSEASRRHGRLVLPDDLTDTATFTARGSSPIYGKTKLLDIMFTLELARRLEGSGVTANAVDPGFNVTGLGRELAFAPALARLLKALHVGDPRRGAALITALATDPAFDGKTGGYYTVRGTRAITPTAPGDDPGWQARLWAETERLLGSERQGHPH